jgi:putative transposase
MRTASNGNILHLSVCKANIHDAKSGVNAIKDALKKYSTIKTVFADAVHRRTFARFIVNSLKRSIEIIKGIKNKFYSEVKRWVVERTFAWSSGYRRLAKCFEKTAKSAKAIMQIAHSITLLKRIN